jgi:hypothetical protein
VVLVVVLVLVLGAEVAGGVTVLGATPGDAAGVSDGLTDPPVTAVLDSPLQPADRRHGTADGPMPEDPVVTEAPTGAEEPGGRPGPAVVGRPSCPSTAEVDATKAMINTTTPDTTAATLRCFTTLPLHPCQCAVVAVGAGQLPGYWTARRSLRCYSPASHHHSGDADRPRLSCCQGGPAHPRGEGGQAPG